MKEASSSCSSEERKKHGTCADGGVNKSRSREKAVDSNKAIMRAFYVKKLLQKSLKSLKRAPQERRAKQALKLMANQKHEHVLLLIAFNRFKRYFKIH